MVGKVDRDKMRENSVGAGEIRGAYVEFLLFLSSRLFFPRSLAFSLVCTDRETGKGYSVAGKQADQTLFTFSVSLTGYDSNVERNVCGWQVPRELSASYQHNHANTAGPKLWGSHEGGDLGVVREVRSKTLC